MISRKVLASVAVSIALLGSCARATSDPLSTSSHKVASPNDNRVPAGLLRGGVLHLALDAMWAGWKPDLDVDSSVTVQAFAERGHAPTIPGPLVRVPHGTEVRITVRNLFSDSTLIVHGLRPGAASADTFSVAPGASREISFIAARPGTFHYWGTTSNASLRDRQGRDAQLSGAIVVDPAGEAADPSERIFVITLIDISPDSTARKKEDIWEIAVNGRSWPHSERLEYAVGDTARWRWINATGRAHPMHLHGFHFRVTAKGTGTSDTLFAAGDTRLAVTELMEPGSSFAMDWTPRRAGNWLIHCHMVPHISPYPDRADSLRGHDVHNQSQHPFRAMAGLVLGIVTTGEDLAPSTGESKTSLRLLVQQRSDSGRRIRRGYVLQRGWEPRRDSVEVPGSPIVLTRGEKTAITIVNRLTQPTSVHWHGLELESVFDGVPGFSGIGSNRTPLIVPGDSFTVFLTPPRAGTYMYHTHMDEEDQLAAGLYAAVIVLEPGASYDPTTDLPLIIGLGTNESGVRGRSFNGTPALATRALTAGKTYRLRLINLLPAAPANVMLAGSDSSPESWRFISKDGAELSRHVTRAARVRIGVGEAYDFEWTPSAGEKILSARFASDPSAPAAIIRQRFIVRP